MMYVQLYCKKCVKIYIQTITAQLHQFTSSWHFPRYQFSIFRLARDRSDPPLRIRDRPDPPLLLRDSRESLQDTGRGNIRRVACRLT